MPCGDGNWTAAVNLGVNRVDTVADSIVYNGAGTADFNCAITAPGGWDIGSANPSFCDAITDGPAADSVNWQFVVTCN